jgi:tetratricopeptide (TPR) repeat protein
VSSANRRAALGALDRVRPLVSGLTRNRPNEELAADLVRAWEQMEVALRALLGGTADSGQALVREVRQRELITIEQAHALVNFHAARDRAQLPGHQVVAPDVAAAREAVSALDAALGGTVVSAPGLDAAGLPPASPSGPAAGLPPGAAPAVATRRRRLPVGIVVLVALLLIAIPLGVWWWMSTRPGSPRSISAAEQLYATGNRSQARLAWAQIARAQPELALPHVYLARIAREQGEVATAQQELTEAIRLEPENALALREMGGLMLATNNPELARRFYVRAVEANPQDRVAQGYLGCALVRLQRYEEGRRFLDRAGSGDWSTCAQQIPPILPPPGGTALMQGPPPPP